MLSNRNHGNQVEIARKTRKALNRSTIKSSKALPELDTVKTRIHQDSERQRVYTSEFIQQQSQYIHNGGINLSQSPASSKTGNKIKPLFSREPEDKNSHNKKEKKGTIRANVFAKPNKYPSYTRKTLISANKSNREFQNSH